MLPLHTYIEAHAQNQAEAPAVKFQQSQYTYQQLNQRANQLGQYLCEIGLDPEDRVAVCLEPSLEIAVSLLAILKSGGVYVPLDPTYPIERLKIILEETKPKVVITQSHLQSYLADIAPRLFCIDQDWDTLVHLPTRNLDREISPTQIAYIIYTSGTTGKPKGVMVSHSNLLHYILVAQEKYNFCAEDVMPAVARFTFSISLFELLSPIVAGGTLLVLERDHILDLGRMAQTLELVSVIHIGPSLMRALLTHITDEKNLSYQSFQGLRHVSTGGDIVPVDILQKMRELFRNAEIYVIYGCTESSCMAATYFVPQQTNIIKSLVGQPFKNVWLRVYDESQNLVAPGIAGEVFIGGEGIAQGYLHRENVTQAKFVDLDGIRFYHTGDIGRFDESGNLEILGRSDFQIKLRGIRIELIEIETVLRQVPGVRDAVVGSYELQPGEKSLVAYVVPNQEKQKNFIGEIRHFLQARLPDYMVPTVFMELDALPLNVNLKVDRMALPTPSLATSVVKDTAYVSPRTTIEKTLVDEWTNILNLERIGIHDNFFELGGHSLIAAQVIYRLQQTFNRQILISQFFEYPTVATLAEHLSSTEQNPHEQDFSLALDCATNGHREDRIALSASQKQLWFLNQLKGGAEACNIPLALHISGDLDISALTRSLTEIVRRHASLRTIFPVVNDMPWQQILEPEPFKIRQVDLRSLHQDERTSRVYQLAQEEAQQPFVLTESIPIRATLIHLEETSNVLLITMHHIVGDDWSLKIIQKELAIIYTALSEGNVSPLEPLPFQYVDYVCWQQEQFGKQVFNQQLVYWKQQLAGAPPLLELPLDHPRPVVQTFRGETEFFTLDKTLTRQLRTLGQRTGSTLFMVLLASFGILLSRYSRQQDLVIGAPVANRNHSELETLVGCFINLMALRINLTDNPTFVELVQRVRQVSLDAYTHHELPFAKLIEELNLDRSLSYTPLFQVLFVLQNTPVESANFGDLELSPLTIESGTSQYDITLMIEEAQDELIGHFEYNCDLFERQTVKRMIGHFETLLEGIVASPHESIASLPLLSQAERHQVLVEWNDTATDYPKDKCVHQLFEAQVEKTPEAIALQFKQDQLTYRELNERANQLAHYLKTKGVKADTLVGICLERSLEMVVGLLGILKAGAAYVPIDPQYPEERLRFIVDDTQIPLLLTQSQWQDHLQHLPGERFCLDTEWTAIANYRSDSPTADVTSDNLMYVIYTSGSTGQPKGVMVPHKGITNLLSWKQRNFGVDSNDKVLQTYPFSFDASVCQIFWPLCNGATLVLAEPDGHKDTQYLVKTIQQEGITIVGLVPSIIRYLLQEEGIEGCRNLKQIICGGEALERELVERCYESLEVERPILQNQYGPTEASVLSNYWDCDSQSPFAIAPIGRPVDNVQLYILDRYLQPAPIGVPGELHIGGEGLARGYLNRETLTAEKFIAHPFSQEPDSRLYKTGDLVRYLPDGNIEFIGRIDYQVKIRGFRIELGEIESALSQHPSVQQCIVIVGEDTPGEKYLIAYWVAETDEPPTVVELRQHLAKTLPDYMVPSAFMRLDAFPLTSNDKVDRRALPKPSSADKLTSSSYVAPRSPLEQELVEIWAKVLKPERIGIHDNFFELGGHSLLATQVISQIREALSVELPLTTLFESPTIAELCEHIENIRWVTSASHNAGMEPLDEEEYEEGIL